MNDKRTVAAAAGFAFVAAWIGFSFGEALLCLLGAAVFWVAAGVVTGTVDLGEAQSRFSEGTEDASAPPQPSPQARPRVQ